MDLFSQRTQLGRHRAKPQRQIHALTKDVSSGLQSAHDGWDGMSRRLSSGSQDYGYMGGARIDHVRHAMALTYPTMHSHLPLKGASINLNGQH